MTGAAVRTMSLDEFLAWERGQDERWEFDAGVTTMMTGGSLPHATISGNIFAALHGHLRGTSGRPFNGGAKVVPGGDKSSYYPDVSVTCSPLTGEENDIVPDPVLVIEVVSPTTEARDRGIKKFRYLATPSLRQYAIVEQDALRVDLYTREGDRWTNTVVEGADAVFRLASVGLELELRAIYDGTPLLQAG